ncbi:choline dehydrogenase-like flavoprotein [Salana multivorans]|uniref:Choline dehydrogenase-like flavoprotein n=1 Tax=Salana multivorans TaxID=120377 RepID=A0A3N2D9G0_9MICO|nr:GMC family oxidoreductase [Salana multivorans]MBN8882096.1 GMC family oxidoreductase [Salana multivorans]OJX97270.1 MAG: gluconate 5-dehydrogenase [Micrococcales bacterium 73-15]ROR96403.1 choline dehydrogenase-like flavoprotein [Salana multivorans]
MIKHTKRKPEPTDVVIIGVGAGGATAAKVLTEAGLRVVGLERGPWLTPEHASGDELKILNRNYLWQDPRLKPRTFRASESEQAVVTNFSATPQVVGGGTTHWGGMVPRMTVDDFRMHSLLGDIEGASLVDWPITYEELEPYYSRVEWEFGTSGLAGANRWEGPRSRGYPTKPSNLSQIGRVFATAMERLGHSTFPMPQGMVTEPYRGREPFSENGFWQQYPDPGSGKSSTLITFVPDALATGLFDLRPDCYVREILVGRDGRATGVLYQDADGTELVQEAKAVIVAGGGIETPRLLLMSTSQQFPDGLANSSGMVGRNATFHQYSFSVGLFDRELHDPLYGWSGHYMNLCSFDFYQTDESRGHVLGSLIFPSMIGHPINWTFPGKPTWGQAAKDADREFFNHSMKIGVLLHDLPVESNRVDLDPDVVDAWGLPVARITHTPHPNDYAQERWQIAKNGEILEAAGASRVIPVNMERITGNTSHELGTARMGNDPAASVVDRWCRTHDVPNLYVFDASFFPTATGINPALTIMANTWRCVDHMLAYDRRGWA